MFRGLPIRLGRADHADFAIAFLGEQRRTQIVISHVGGQDDRALRGRELIEPLRASDLVGELFPVQFVDRGFGNRPREIGERPKSAEMIHSAGRTRQDDSEIGHDRAPGRRREKEKEEGPEDEEDRIKMERQVDDGPVEIFSPKNSAHGEATEPVARNGCYSERSRGIPWHELKDYATGSFDSASLRQDDSRSRRGRRISSQQR